MENLVSTAGQYGALGLTLFASFWYINKKDSEHREERKEMVEQIAKQHTEMIEIIKANTTALIELVTIIKTKV
jgi:hypothetical protein